MTDNHTKEVRSRNMSHIRSKNTKPEEKVRKYLFSKGFRYKKNVHDLPGCPDIVLPKYKTVIFVNGCFWHKHDCPRFAWPSSNEEYWIPKIERNVERDITNTQTLRSMGWNVLVVWECQLKKKVFDTTMSQLEIDIQRGAMNMGKELLNKIGAAWFVSYAYYEIVDDTHKNWTKVSTAQMRSSNYKRSREYHREWLKEVLSMNSANLNKNTIGLNADQIKAMANDILQKI